MALADSINRFGTRAAQPAAGPENSGCLYRVTDEGNALEQSDGATWVPIASGSVSGLMVATVTLAHADILTLPTTPFELIAAPGGGKAILPIRAVLIFPAAVPYTNIDPDAFAFFGLAGAEEAGYLPNDPSLGIPLTQCSDLFGSTGAAMKIMTWPYQNDQGSANGWGILTFVQDYAALDNLALQLSLNNNGAGNLAGGDPANTMTIRVIYEEVDLP